MPLKPSTLFFLLPAATTGIILSTYLYTRPGPSPNYDMKTYKRSDSLSPSTLTSKSLAILNPRKHIQGTDSRSVTLVSKLGDEEILARFTKGFFNGWVFVPEKGILGVLRVFGRQLARVGFTDIPTTSPELMIPAQLPNTTFPAKYTRLLNSNFMILDHHLKVQSPAPEAGESSYIDIAFGDDRKGFAGMHRFEVIRGEGNDEVTIWYSSVTCNPSVDNLPLPTWVYGFHEVYAERLFWDGVRGVLRE